MEAGRYGIFSYNFLPIPFETKSFPEPRACVFSSRLEASKSELELKQVWMFSLLHPGVVMPQGYTASAYNKSAHDHQAISSVPSMHFR